MRLEQRDFGFPDAGNPGLVWLGQAGFWIETGAHRILIDPYLSDSLAKKYRGKKNDHVRMMPPPMTVEDLPRPDIVLITHGHTDHLDPETLAPLHARFPDVPFVVPASCEALARERIGESARLILADAGEVIAPLAGLSLTVFPAAHEDLDLSEDGHHLFLGFGINADGFRIYHSGDSVPFEGLRTLIETFQPQLCLMPVNGRDAQRKRDGVPGNFHLNEAIDLASGCAFLIPHHFGMFAFNTISTDDIDAAASVTVTPKVIRPEPGRRLAILK